MRKALAKTYIYELIFLCIYLIAMDKLLEIFEEKFILGVFIILIINIVVFFYLIILLNPAIFYLSNHEVSWMKFALKIVYLGIIAKILINKEIAEKIKNIFKKFLKR